MVITELARSWAADLTVVGSRRLRQWEALIAGSTSHDVVRLSDRLVLIAGGAWRREERAAVAADHGRQACFARDECR